MKRGLFGFAILAAALAPTTRANAAPCGPTYCPSYGTALHSCPWKSGIRCRVDPVKKDNPSFTELSDLFDKIAVGPSKYGSLGWSYSMTLTDGNGKPTPPTKVPAHYPCVLLKAVSAHESVGWNQFCLPTGPVCTGVQQTIVACDCGYGLMQVTSGMNAGETSAYDANRVASDAAYNVSVGTQIYGGKWGYGPSVGDRRVDVIEDWYFATWAYNGYAFVNNPNNPAYAADRKPYRDPGATSGGNYPYQERIWGYVRVPYGLKEAAKVAGYKAYALSYPNRAQICSSCGKPTSDISDPSPLHPSDCGSGGPAAPPPGPRYEISADPEGDDAFGDGTSKAVVDHMEGDEYVVDLIVKNIGDKASPNVDLGVFIEEPFVKGASYVIESDAGSPGTFKLNDANDRKDNPPHDDPGQSFTVHMNAFSIGETKRIHLKTKAAAYSIGAADHPDVRVWVKLVDGVYGKPEFDSKPDNPSGQAFNGGDLKAWAQADVFSRTRWSFDGGTLEGWSAAAGAELVLSTETKSMIINGKGDDPQAISPETSFDAAALPVVRMRAKSIFADGKGRIYFSTKDAPGFDESRVVDFTVQPNTETKDVLVDMSNNPNWKGTITRLRIDPAAGGEGAFTLEDIRMAGPGGTLPPDDAGVSGDASTSNPGVPPADASGDVKGCACRVTGETSEHGASAALVVVGIAALAAGRRRRRIW